MAHFVTSNQCKTFEDSRLNNFRTNIVFLCLPQIVRTFSFKGMTNKLFGQEAPEQREARLKLLEELIVEGEETVKEKTVECEWVMDTA